MADELLDSSTFVRVFVVESGCAAVELSRFFAFIVAGFAQYYNIIIYRKIGYCDARTGAAYIGSFSDYRRNSQQDY